MDAKMDAKTPFAAGPLVPIFLLEFWHESDPNLFTSGLFLRLKSGLPVGLGGAEGPVRLQAGLT
jgi:hypothetical protein